MIDLILDLIFIGAIVIAFAPVLLGLYGVFLVLKIFLSLLPREYGMYAVVHATGS